MTPVAAVAIHATGLVIGEAGVLIRGPSGVGKTRLALLLLDEAPQRGRFARLIGDDRILLQRHGDRLVAAPHPAIAGLVEQRTQGLGAVPFLARCVIRLVVDLHAPDMPLARYPDATNQTVSLAGVANMALMHLQAPPDALSCRFVFDALAMPLKAMHDN